MADGAVVSPAPDLESADKPASAGSVAFIECKLKKFIARYTEDRQRHKFLTNGIKIVSIVASGTLTIIIGLSAIFTDSWLHTYSAAITLIISAFLTGVTGSV